MRLILPVMMAMMVPATVTLAQGTKDPANFGAVTNSNSKSQQTTAPSRPTSVRNVPIDMLPAGTAVQRVYRDGKLQTIVR